MKNSDELNADGREHSRKEDRPKKLGDKLSPARNDRGQLPKDREKDDRSNQQREGDQDNTRNEGR